MRQVKRGPRPDARDDEEDLRPLIAVAVDDDGAPVFAGCIEYADGGLLGIRRDDGEVTEWPAELVRLELAEEDHR
jgi:hypothetical protein